jgi:hypothetical protein
MVLFKGSTLNYISGSQLVLGEGFFASSPAQLKSIRAGDGLTLADANGVLTLSANPLPSLTQPLGYDVYGHIVVNYDWGLDVYNGKLVVDTGAVQQLSSWTAPLVDANNTVSLSYGAGLKLDSNNALAVDTSTIEPWFSPQMPLAITGSGAAAKLKLNIGWALKLDSNSYLAVDASVLGFSSGDGGTTWRIGWPNLPSIPGISITGGNPTTDYTVIQQPVAVTAPITLAADKKTIGLDKLNLGVFGGTSCTPTGARNAASATLVCGLTISSGAISAASSALSVASAAISGVLSCASATIANGLTITAGAISATASALSCA